MTGAWRRLPTWLGGLHFSVVEPGVLSRSAMPTPAMIDWLAASLGVRSLVSFRDQQGAEWEEAHAERLGLRFFDFDMGSKHPPTPWQLERWRAILANPDNYPIHCHCHGGADRTGLMVALFRIEHQDWPLRRALREIAARGGLRSRSAAQRHWLLHAYPEARALRPARPPR
jgi:protein tyrosine/serine phosphatase